MADVKRGAVVLAAVHAVADAHSIRLAKRRSGPCRTKPPLVVFMDTFRRWTAVARPVDWFARRHFSVLIPDSFSAEAIAA